MSRRKTIITVVALLMILFVALVSITLSSERDIIEGAGQLHSPTGKWLVELSLGTPGIKAIPLDAPHFSLTNGNTLDFSFSPLQPPDIEPWTNYTGCFAYFQDETTLWVYNGRAEMLKVQLKSHTLTSERRFLAADLTILNCPFPVYVRTRD